MTMLLHGMLSQMVTKGSVELGSGLKKDLAEKVCLAQASVSADSNTMIELARIKMVRKSCSPSELFQTEKQKKSHKL